MITADPNNQKPFVMHLEGVMVGQDFNFDIEYTPGQTQKLLEGLAKEALAELKLAAHIYRPF